jgi:hypothetical protein
VTCGWTKGDVRLIEYETYGIFSETYHTAGCSKQPVLCFHTF